MIRLLRHSRGLMVAIAILALTAGAVVAGSSALSTPAAGLGLERAGTASGKTVPVAGQVEGAAPDADEDEDVEEDEPPEDQPAADAAAEHPDNHGLAVSTAARAATPTGFANHGEYVKSVATANHGQATAAAAKAAHSH